MTRVDEVLGPVIGQLQTDTFCEGCGYNLHTQAVIREQRLGILVCRCPECGRFAPAGHGATASRVWVSRFLGLALAAWALFELGLFLLCTIFLGAVAYGHVQNNVRFTQISSSATGGPASKTYRPASSQFVWTIYRPDPANADAVREQQFEYWVMAVLALGLGAITGSVFAVLLWHLRWPWRAVAWLPPLVACGFIAVTWSNDSMSALIRPWGLHWIYLYCAIECAGVGAGLLLGRPITRGLVRLLIPPRPRQHLAFLWVADGKPPPAIKSAGRAITSSGGAG